VVTRPASSLDWGLIIKLETPPHTSNRRPRRLNAFGAGSVRLIAWTAELCNGSTTGCRKVTRYFFCSFDFFWPRTFDFDSFLLLPLHNVYVLNPLYKPRLSALDLNLNVVYFSGLGFRCSAGLYINLVICCFIIPVVTEMVMLSTEKMASCPGVLHTNDTKTPYCSIRVYYNQVYIQANKAWSSSSECLSKHLKNM